MLFVWSQRKVDEDLQRPILFQWQEDDFLFSCKVGFLIHCCRRLFCGIIHWVLGICHLSKVDV